MPFMRFAVSFKWVIQRTFMVRLCHGNFDKKGIK